MISFNIIASLLLIFLHVYALGQDTWVRTYGGTKAETGTTILPIDDGYIISGYFSSNDGDFIGLNRGQTDCFALKVNNDGAIVWKSTFGGMMDDKISSSVATSDGGFILVGSSFSKDGDFINQNKGGSDVLIVKISHSGDLVWLKTIGGSGEDYANGLVQLEDGGCIIVGTTSSNDNDFVNMNLGKTDAFVVKLSDEGEVLWKQVIGGTGYDTSESIVKISDTDYFIIGGTNSSDFTSENKNDDRDLFLVKLQSNGNILLKRRIVISGQHEYATRAIFTKNELALVGSFEKKKVVDDFQGPFNPMLARFNFNGDLLGIKYIDAPPSRYAASLCPIGKSTLLLASDNGYGSGSEIYLTYLTKKNLNDFDIRERIIGGTKEEIVNAIVESNDGGIILTGHTKSTDGLFAQASNKGDCDLFLAKLDSNGMQHSTTTISESLEHSHQLLIHPNPFTNNAIVTFTLNTASSVDIRIVNLYGQTLQILQQGFMEAGPHSLPYVDYTLPSGIYLITFTSDFGIETMPFVLMH